MSWALSPAELAAVRETLKVPGLVLDIRDEWGSAASHEHRAKIRAELARRFPAQAGPSTLDLSLKPELPGHSVSISHCALAGGFIAAEKPARIGFDIEEANRPSQRVLDRIAAPEEIAAAPSLAHLWTAKEAAFKSLPPESQPTVFTEISVSGWSRHPSEDLWIYLAKSRGHSGAYGIGAVFGRLRLAVAFFATQV